MKSFSFNRFGKTLLWVWGMNFRSLVMWTTGFSLVIFFAEMMFWYLNKGMTAENIVGVILLFITIFFMIGVGASISSMFLEVNKKPRREAFLMLPASNLEKFLSVVLYFTVAWTVCVFLSIVVGDTLRMMFRSLVSGDEWVSCIPRLIDSFMPSFLYRSIYDYTLSYKVMQMVVLTAMILWIHSFYTLGATFLRKYTFVLTSIAFIIIIAIFGNMVSYYQMELFKAVWEGDHYVSQEVGTLAYVLAVALPLLTVFNYWVSFHIFKGFQLITNKWTNYDILKR
jgi:hypothetical protein